MSIHSIVDIPTNELRPGDLVHVNLWNDDPAARRELAIVGVAPSTFVPGCLEVSFDTPSERSIVADTGEHLRVIKANVMYRRPDSVCRIRRLAA